jgi:hypothetical protein
VSGQFVISQNLSPETIAIVEASAPEVQGRRAAITFSAWHHLETEPARRLLFEQFTLNGDVVGLLDAIVATVRQGRWSGAAPFSLPYADLGWFEAALESALIRAIKEVLNASISVLNAWREAFRFFTDQLVSDLKA